MKRRAVLRFAGAGALWLGLAAHSPYRQWEVYRKTRLVVLVSAAENDSVVLGERLAAIYLQQFPSSSATLARARDTNDAFRLIASRQLDVALLRGADAYAAFAGKRPYGDNGALPLRALAVLGEYLFLCRDDLPAASAYMLTEALAKRWHDIDPALVGGAPDPRPRKPLAIPLHPGAHEYYRDHR